jgi:hypothetical protein
MGLRVPRSYLVAMVVLTQPSRTSRTGVIAPTTLSPKAQAILSDCTNPTLSLVVRQDDTSAVVIDDRPDAEYTPFVPDQAHEQLPPALSWREPR